MTRHTGPSRTTRETIHDRACGTTDMPACERCGNRPYDQIHHRRPRGAGGSNREGTNHPSNLLALCAECHRRVEADRVEAMHSGWLVAQGADPAETPVLYRGRWVVLTNHATRPVMTGQSGEEITT